MFNNPERTSTHIFYSCQHHHHPIQIVVIDPDMDEMELGEVLEPPGPTNANAPGPVEPND